MIKLVLSAIWLLASLANAELYKCPDKETGLTEYVANAAVGCRTLSGKLLATQGDVDKEHSRAAAAARKFDYEQAGKQVERLYKLPQYSFENLTEAEARKLLGKLALAEQFPGKCFDSGGVLLCHLVPGMPIGTASVVFDLRSNGYSETASGRDDRYEYGKCRVYARDGKVTAVFC